MLSQEARDLQNNAVSDLVEVSQQKKYITFKAPTGSGKTHMMADMMNRVLEADPNVVFLASTLSRAELGKQNYDKFAQLASEGSFPNLKPYLVKSEYADEEKPHIPIGYNCYILPVDLYKKGSLLFQTGAMEGFLLSITDSVEQGGLAKHIYLIVDESHRETKNLNNLKGYFKKWFNFSATPKIERGQDPDVEITVQDAVEARLIKSLILNDPPHATVSDAIDRFRHIKAEYQKHHITDYGPNGTERGVNPCLLIQISNKHKADQEIEDILRVLKQPANKDLHWMKIVAKDKKSDSQLESDTNDRIKLAPIAEWKEAAKQSNSTIDIIIFKLVISEGWDIPRACMLYQVRDSHSKQLDEQVIGRVRRNPCLSNFSQLSEEAQALVTKAWVWGIAEQKDIHNVSLWQDSQPITSNIKVRTTRLTNDLATKKDFHQTMTKILGSSQMPSANKSIFELYQKFGKADTDIQTEGIAYATDYQKWFTFTENLGDITKAKNQYVHNYEISMVATEEEKDLVATETFPEHSAFQDNGNHLRIKEWVWRRDDGDKDFSFDSEAEQKWAKLLDDIQDDFIKHVDIDVEGQAKQKQIYLWGKNFVQDSEIKFEYYLDGSHFSYPDFVMMDHHDRIHIFEVKSVNKSAKFHTLDGEEYEAKLQELKNAYLRASAVTQQIFYLPILFGDNWTIYQYLDGQQHQLTEELFKEFLAKPPANHQ